MMKICILSLNLYWHGGIQRVVPSVLNVLSNKHDITILMPYDEQKDTNVFGIKSNIKIVNMNNFSKHCKGTVRGLVSIVLWKLNQKLGFLDSKVMLPLASAIMFSERQKEEILQFINSHEFDIVIGVTDYYSLLLGMIAPKLNASTIGWCHNTFESYFELKGKNSFGLKKLCQREFAHLDQLMVLTDVDNKKYEDCFSVSTVTMYNPVAFQDEECTANEHMDLIFVGRLHQYQKGLDYLVEIMRYISQKRPNILLKVIGDGPDRKKMENLIRKYHLERNIYLVGMTSEVKKYYSDASIFLHTSRYEGFGVVLIEAMAFGIPIVAFHNNGPDEIITNNIDGILVEKYDTKIFAEKVLALLDDSELYKKLSDAARLRAKNFSADQIAKKFEDNLYNILSKRNKQ